MKTAKAALEKFEDQILARTDIEPEDGMDVTRETVENSEVSIDFSVYDCVEHLTQKLINLLHDSKNKRICGFKI